MKKKNKREIFTLVTDTCTRVKMLFSNADVVYHEVSAWRREKSAVIMFQLDETITVAILIKIQLVRKSIV